MMKVELAPETPILFCLGFFHVFCLQNVLNKSGFWQTPPRGLSGWGLFFFESDCQEFFKSEQRRRPPPPWRVLQRGMLGSHQPSPHYPTRLQSRGCKEIWWWSQGVGVVRARGCHFPHSWARHVLSIVLVCTKLLLWRLHTRSVFWGPTLAICMHMPPPPPQSWLKCLCVCVCGWQGRATL